MFKLSLVILATKNSILGKDLIEFSKDFSEVLVLIHKDEVNGWLEKNKIKDKGNFRLIIHSIKNNFAALRNLAHQESRNNYLFHLDTDEKIVIKNKKDFDNLMKNLVKDVYFIKRNEFFLGKVLKHGESLFHARIVKKELRWQGLVHEEVKNYVNGEKIKSFFLIHKQNIALPDFIQRLNYYSTLRAKDLFQKEKQSNGIKLISHFLAKLNQDLFLRLGILDSYRGIFQAFLMAYFSAMVQVKLWLLGRKHD